MSIRTWRQARNARIAAAEAAAATSREQHERIDEQWPEVHSHVDRARGERERNHLSQLFHVILQED